MSEGNKQQEFSIDLLKLYYERLFPYDAMYNWISYGNNDDVSRDSQAANKDYFANREWSFTIEDDIYIRYQSFRDKNEFKEAIKKRQPHKIDIGAVFSAPPKDHTTVKPELFKTLERELVFDIDMTDYDDIRNCCTGANICRRCWPYMTMAIKVLDTALRSDFAFRNILWIYSGRRGVHCWVCDQSARTLPNETRAAIVEYLSVQTGSQENSSKKLRNPFSKPCHPMIRRSYELLEPYFLKYIIDETGQGLLATKDRYVKILATIPNETVRLNLFDEWKNINEMTSTQRWKSLKEATSPPQVNKINSNKKSKVDYSELESWRMELIFTHCYPRLDAEVSKSQNHLLKSPFCVHPKTGRVCVPIDPTIADSFDPFAVPTLRVLCEEVDEYDRLNCTMDEGENNDVIQDWEKTSMKAAIKVFEKTFMSQLRSTNKQIFREKSAQIAAMNVDF